MTIVKFKCSKCLRDISYTQTSCASGYAITDTNDKICYSCCALEDEEFMNEHGKIALYLSKNDGKFVVSNWPGSLTFNVIAYQSGKHNWTGERTDVWFFDNDGRKWHGVTYGDTQVCHCKRTKKALAA